MPFYNLFSAPLHVQWILGMLCAAFVLNIAVGVCGALCRRTRLLPTTPSLYGGTAFPTCWDILYTVLFLFYFVFSTGSETLLAGGGDSNPLQNKGILLVSLAFTALQYVPMLLRIMLLRPAPDRTPCEGGSLPPIPGQQPASAPPTGSSAAGMLRDICLAVASVVFVILFAALYEHSGLMKLIVKLTGCPEYQDIVQVLFKADMASGLMIIVGAVIIAPIGEECCFRAFLYGSVRKYAGPIAAALTSSLLFAAIHVSLASTLPLFVFALVQCVLYEKTRSLRAPILTHALFNAIQVSVTLLFPPNA